MANPAALARPTEFPSDTTRSERTTAMKQHLLCQRVESSRPRVNGVAGDVRGRWHGGIATFPTLWATTAANAGMYVAKRPTPGHLSGGLT